MKMRFRQILARLGSVFLLATTCVACDKVKPPLPELQPPPASAEPVKPVEPGR